MDDGPARYRVIDMHTAGEPVRIVVEGYPRLEGATLLEKRRFVRDRLDHVRRRLMLEPRGHGEMYGVIPTEPGHPDCALAVLFMHTGGYSTMCGHATIAIGRWAVESGLVEGPGPRVDFKLECPCGPVAVSVDTRDGRVSFESVPAFVLHRDATVDVPGFGPVRLDVSYGGAFYAILPAGRLGLDLARDPIGRQTAVAAAVTEAVRAALPIRHPTEPDLSFLYGTILTDDTPPGAESPSRNLCLFGHGQIDRSPTGSGVTARMALAHARGELAPGTVAAFAGPTGAPFRAELVGPADCGGVPAVVVRVSGRAYHSGRAEFIVEQDDPLADGFALGFDPSAD